MKTLSSVIAIMTFLFFSLNSHATEKPYYILLDADRTHHTNSAVAIEQGFKAAFADVNNIIQGIPIEFIVRDHRANSRRAKLHLDEYLENKQILAYAAGIHSPPLIIYREFINENKILTLVPWAAGSPITRYPSADNWIFRLSIDDSKAAEYLVQYTLESKKCQTPHLIIEQTPWGESNLRNLNQAFADRELDLPNSSFFKWTMNNDDAIKMLVAAKKKQADCLIFVGGAVEGYSFYKAVQQVSAKTPIISHWGITGGDFFEKIRSLQGESVDLSFLQTCFSFNNPDRSAYSHTVLEKIKRLFHKTEEEILTMSAPTGFIHAYDLGKILIAAMQQIQLTGQRDADSAALKEALENLQKPVQGLIMQYRKPFALFTKEQLDAHEALGAENLCMANYINDRIILTE